MKGVILAGGLGTRLLPLTRVTNKHLLPVYDQPMIFYPIQTLIKAGIKEIMIVTGGPFAGHFISVLRNGEDFGLKNLRYAYQEGEGGIPVALSLAEGFVGKDNVTVILGDNCTNADISKEVASFQEGARIFLKKVPDPDRFGVPVFKEGKITNIIEKPSKPPSNFAVTGVYIYDKTVFDRIRDLKPSCRNELEVTDLNNSYLREGKLSWANLRGHWNDAGTAESLYKIGTYRRKMIFVDGKERE